jgi:hypothetical protein
MAHQMTSELRECIDNCENCRTACLETVNHCLTLGGKHADPGHIRLLLDCADICATSSAFMSRGSDQHSAVCGVCAEICDRCARSCDSMGSDATMNKCAEACRRCAQSCHRMARAAATA